MRTIKLLLLSAFTLFFFSTSYGQLKVAADGSVGIGTTTPQALLHLVKTNGVLRLGPSVAIQPTRTDGNPHTLFLMDVNDDFVFNFSTLAPFGNRPSSVIMPVGAGKVFDVRDNNNSLIMRVDGDTKNVGIDELSPSFKLELGSGDAAKPGGGVWTTASDRRLKKDVRPFTDGLEQVLQINPVYFRYNGKAGFKDEKEYVGVIAQEIQEVAPYTVKPFVHKEIEMTYTRDAGTKEVVKSEEEYLSYDGTAVQYMLINAIKEQQAKIDELVAKIESLEHQATGNQGFNNDGSINEQTIVLGSSDQARLGQNSPNPFNENTTIEYFIPEFDGNAKAAIRIFDQNGTLLKETNISGEGMGRLKVEAGALAAGSYIYALVIDGQVVDTKKMVLTK